MFKTVLAGLFLDSSKFIDYENNPQTIKWSIFGIQYDKLGLAEKGLKVASIKWYRDKSREADNKIKGLIEIKYALGNEVYRDETGIYFVVPENIIGEYDNGFYNLCEDFTEVKTDIQGIFNEIFGGEIYPAIFLTEPSRGLMNLGYLVEKAKENFLKAEYPKEFRDELNSNGDPNANGICQVCGMRLGHRRKDGNFICDVCETRLKSRVKNWLSNLSGETIWLSELQDENGRVALVTLKFELEQWLNGNLVNSLITRKEKYYENLKLMKETLIVISKLYQKNAFFLNSFKDSSGRLNIPFLIDIEKNIKKVSAHSFNRKFGGMSLKVDINNNTVEIKDKRGNLQNLKNLLSNKNFISYLKLYDFEIFNKLSQDAYNGCRKNNETFNDYIRQIFFSSIRGTKWEELIKNSILNDSINWENEEIKWNKLSSVQIDFLSCILLQFLLRKNPSPARLKRIWETTREFFESLESNIIELAGIEKERCKRWAWHNVNSIENGEYRDGDFLFWVDNQTVYLISSIEKIGNKTQFKLKKYNDKNFNILQTLDISNAKEMEYRPYFTILSPTPISWQFIIPAKNLPQFIKSVQEEYYKNFKWVYGKLPLHIGVVIQNYKSPLYIGIKALRKIRRDGIEWENLGKEISAKDFKSKQKEALYYQTSPEDTSLCEDYYSLFEKISGKGKYDFYIYPNLNTGKKVWLEITQRASDTVKFKVYFNTIDFEFLDSNIRRNDIYYKKDKRANKWKKLRPFCLHDWQYFQKFREYFSSTRRSSSKLQKLISIIYSKLDDWDDNEALRQFMISTFINILELGKGNKDEFVNILGVDSFENLKEVPPEEFREKLLMLIDIFEFWHVTLKEV